MKVILGLGNPGKEYEHTRHNVGWWLVDHLADVGLRRLEEGRPGEGRAGPPAPACSETVRLVKPQTYMNLTGGVLVQYARRPFWSAANDLLVLVDDVAIPVGTWRFRAEGARAATTASSRSSRRSARSSTRGCASASATRTVRPAGR